MANEAKSEKELLCEAAHWCAARGWVPATSGNFSVRDGGRIFISRSGLDKGQMRTRDLLELDLEGNVLSGAGKPSAETVLHIVIYRDYPEAGAILHVHSVWNTLLSARFAGGRVVLENYELLKALDGVTTHEHREAIPVLSNSQDYHLLSRELTEALKEHPGTHGVLLGGHGLYTWGKSVADARRHVEALEFLFEVEGRRIFGS